MLKVCNRCGIAKELDQFYMYNKLNPNKRMPTCIQCESERSKKRGPRKSERRKELRHIYSNKLRIIKSNYVCVYCGESDPVCLDFHHMDTSQKEYTIASMVGSGFSMEKIKKEIEKCIALCANCHRKLHAGTIEIDLTILGSSSAVEQLALNQ